MFESRVLVVFRLRMVWYGCSTRETGWRVCVCVFLEGLARERGLLLGARAVFLHLRGGGGGSGEWTGLCACDELNRVRVLCDLWCA